ncbi:macrophage infectivity potentiator [Legionella beliardensis]|uniref:Peptidyl-prolyl cis-trans isomerase n=2 Tax=Legionella beliardensis TaxID=91822 RepID=A0A378I0K8_9GAMM|nr:FKBP-type peptidyl-prolyl cis-trans isomerase [Legionella beliardensis]STX28689.1 macrophage infectivity potentiator [Legionella beliardensis]
MKMKLVAAAISLVVSTAFAVPDTTNTSTTTNGTNASATTPSTSTVLSSDMDKLSYSIGADLGRNFKKQGIDISPNAMARGLQDGMNGGQLLLTDDQMKDVLNKFQKDLMAKRNAEFTKKADENKNKGDAFLNQNKSKEGVVALPSGLQYKVIENGKGAKPGKDDMVTVEYTGKLIDGQVFDSTEKSGKPAEFKVSQVIPGWTEVLQLMPAGSTWEVYLPASLAYGPRGIGGAIGPNETLIFKIHLISVKKSSEA